jgi:thiol-disulfide isomerase/thioredoxin
MTRRYAIFLVAIAVLCTAHSRLRLSADDELPSAAKAYQSLTGDFKQAVADWSQKYNLAPNKIKRVERFDQWPGWDFLPRFQKFAEQNPDAPEAFDALAWILEHSRFVGNGDRRHFPYEVYALDLIHRRYLDDKRLPTACVSLGAYPSPARESFLRTCTTHGDNRTLHGIASLALAELLSEKSTSMAPPWFDRPITDELARHNADHMAPEIKTYCRQSGPLNHREESKVLLKIVERDYPDIKYPKPFPVLKSIPTLAQVAKFRLSELEGLIIGQLAPPIEGTGLDGQKDSLKTHRGKVVIVSFWATWCPPCVAKIPSQKHLVERFADKPFVLLGVNCDDDVAVAQKFSKANDMTWYSWSDPISGNRSILTAWHVVQLPSVVVIDHEGSIRFKDIHGKELEQAIESLLKEVP